MHEAGANSELHIDEKNSQAYTKNNRDQAAGGSMCFDESRESLESDGSKGGHRKINSRKVSIITP